MSESLTKINPKCIQCDKIESIMWRQTEAGHLCRECSLVIETIQKAEMEQDEEGGHEKKTRKSTRATRFKAKAAPVVKPQPKGRSRRNIFKKIPFKTPTTPATTRTVEYVFYKGSYIQIGDIVSLMGTDDNIYYAQVRGLLIDTFLEKSAYLSWLIPTKSSPNPNEGFDPSTYLIGPDEDFSRKLSCLEFVMHAPSTYYHDKSTPFPPPDYNNFQSNPAGYIWTTLPAVERNKPIKLE